MSEYPFILWVNRVVKACWKLYRIDVYSMPHIDYWRLFKLDTSAERAAYLVSLAVD